MDIQSLYQIYQAHPNIVTDTRKIATGGLFFALKGERFDGNAYAQEALNQGAAFAVVSDPDLMGDQFIYTPDTLVTLQALARYHRQQLNIPVLAITGSNGKTTTKELITAVLSTTYKVYATAGNFNNHIGVPLTLLAVAPDTEIIICEMGANHPKEIKFLCEIAEPNFGLITNIGKAHLEGFGSLEGVMTSKGELFDHLRLHQGFGFVNADDKRTRALGEKLSDKTTYGLEEENHPDIHLDYLERHADKGFSLHSESQNVHIYTNMFGRYNASNMLAAYTVGVHFKVARERIINALSAFESKGNRSETVQYKNCHFIMDAYNANPSSMELALKAFSEKHPGGWVILGDMKELGDETHAAHLQMLSLAISLPIEKIFLIGSAFEKASQDANINNAVVNHYSEIADLINDWNWADCRGKSIFLKGSRSMKLEELLKG